MVEMALIESLGLLNVQNSVKMLSLQLHFQFQTKNSHIANLMILNIGND